MLAYLDRSDRHRPLLSVMNKSTGDAQFKQSRHLLCSIPLFANFSSYEKRFSDDFFFDADLLPSVARERSKSEQITCSFSALLQSKNAEQDTENSREQFSCEYCSKKCRSRHLLRSHMVVHSGTKKHICKHCKKSFARGHDLKRHERTHNIGQGIYQCMFCSRTYSRQDSFKRHSKVCRGKKPSEGNGAETSSPETQPLDFLSDDISLLDDALFTLDYLNSP